MSKTINIEVANTPELLSRGLMHRQTLDKDSGMLFKFPDKIYASFWGANTYIPLDIAFINDGKVAEIKQIVPLSTKSVYSSFPCQLALEVNAGFFENNGIKIGEEVNIDEKNSKIKFGDNQ